MKLTIENNSVDWIELKPGEYARLQHKDIDWGLIFKCPKCGEPLGINTGTSAESPKWTIDFKTLTAKPSIKHERDGRGCGWHGYLTNGELKAC